MIRCSSMIKIISININLQGKLQLSNNNNENECLYVCFFCNSIEAIAVGFSAGKYAACICIELQQWASS